MRVIDHPRASALEEAPAAGDVYRVRRREAVAIWAALTVARRGLRRVLDLGCGDGYRPRPLERVAGAPPHLLLRRLPVADRSWWLRGSLARLRPSGFLVRADGLDEAVDLLAVVRA